MRSNKAGLTNYLFTYLFIYFINFFCRSKGNAPYQGGDSALYPKHACDLVILFTSHHSESTIVGKGIIDKIKIINLRSLFVSCGFLLCAASR